MPYDLSLRSSPNDDQEDSLKKINGLLWEGLAGADGLGPSPNDDEEESLRKINGILYLTRAGAAGLPDYELKTASFTAEAGKAYAVDTTGTTTTPVLPSTDWFGVRFVGLSWDATTQVTIAWQDDDGGITVNANNDDTVDLTVCRNVTKGALVEYINDGIDVTAVTAELIDPETANDLVYDGGHDETLAGGFQGETTLTPFNVTLPASPSVGDVIAVADARGSWNSNPVVVLRNGHKIEATDTNFENNAAGTFFSLLYIDSTTGWRVLAAEFGALSGDNWISRIVNGVTEYSWDGGTTWYRHQPVLDAGVPRFEWVKLS